MTSKPEWNMRIGDAPNSAARSNAGRKQSLHSEEYLAKDRERQRRNRLNLKFDINGEEKRNKQREAAKQRQQRRREKLKLDRGPQVHGTCSNTKPKNITTGKKADRKLYIREYRRRERATMSRQKLQAIRLKDKERKRKRRVKRAKTEALLKQPGVQLQGKFQGLPSRSTKSAMVTLVPSHRDTSPSVRHGSLRPFYCRYCDRYVSNFDFFKRHIVRHEIIYNRHWKRPMKAQMTEEGVQTEVLKLYTCIFPSCNAAFFDVEALAVHIGGHVPQNISNANQRNRQFDTRPNDQEDTLIDMFGKDVHLHECDFCPKFFSSARQLIIHRLTHVNKMYECDICHKKLNTRQSLRSHRSTHSAMYKCDVCQKRLATKQTLHNHRLTHLKDACKPFPCDDCKASFVNLPSLRSHKKRTHGGKPFPCDACGKCFGTRDILRRHVRTHTGEEPYVCEECGKSFKQVSNLISHRRSNHTGEKPYVCPTCNKAFSQKFNLTKHIRTHTGEKPFRCVFCNQLFPRTDNLKVHINAKHPGKQVIVYKVQ